MAQKEERWTWNVECIMLSAIPILAVVFQIGKPFTSKGVDLSVILFG